MVPQAKVKKNMKYTPLFVLVYMVYSMFYVVLNLMHSEMENENPYKGVVKILSRLVAVGLVALFAAFLWQWRAGWLSLGFIDLGFPSLGLALGGVVPFMIANESQNLQSPVMNIVIAGLTAAVCIPLSLFAIILVPIPGLPSASGFWIPAAFYFLLTLWFGPAAAVGAFISTWLGMSIFGGFTLNIFLDGAIGDFLAPLVAFFLFKFVFQGDTELAEKKDWTAWIVSVPVASLVCGLWVNTVNFLFGIITWPFWWIGVVTYLIGDSAAVFIVGTPLLKALSRYVKDTPLYYEK